MNTEKLIELRKSHGLKQHEVAEKIGIGRTAYIGYEKGQVDPPLSRMKRLAAIYGVTIDELA